MSLPVFNIKSFKIDLKLLALRSFSKGGKIKNLKLTKGFTLIELLVVISIIAILMAVASVSYLNAQQKGRDNKRKSDLKAVQQALEIYYNQNGKYPTVHGTGNNFGIRCNIISPVDNTNINWGAAFTCNSITYMNPLPKDPISNTSTPYYYFSDATTTPPNQTYKLFAKLENSNDKDFTIIPAGCNSGSTPSTAWQTNTATGLLYYCVINP